MPLQSERQGRVAEPITRMYPPIRAGVCDFCGIRDNKQKSEIQYLLPHEPSCPYFRQGGLGQLACTYCPDNADPYEVVKNRLLMVHDSPTNPGQLIVVCDSLGCSSAHEKRFKLNR